MMTSGSTAIKGVILCADDFAVNESASTGIVKLASMRRLSATSVMVLSSRWPRDVALLQALRGRMDVGLHLDWTSEFAIASGHGMALRSAMLKATLGGFGRGAAATVTRGVIERQLDAFEAQWKAPPDFVDGHQHVQQFAGIREALVQALVSRYGARKPYVRISRAPAGASNAKIRLVAAMGAAALETLVRDAKIALTPALLGSYDFSGDAQRYARLMKGWLNVAPAGGLIMCHPALAAESGDAIGAARQREFAYLSGTDFPAALAQAGAELARGAGR